ncbi:M20/M25/M40 family metallo-hydrolase [Micromonospora pallida]|nr:M20/M25/M40 family metallo-hydrolase [Micromonospora pallida]
MDPATREKVRAHVTGNLDATIEELKEYIRIPTVSVGDGTGMREAAEFLARRYRDFGCQEVEIVETETFPGVWAYYDAGSPITILNYNMYDVRAVGDLTAWDTDPFEPVVAPRGDIPAVLYGRGARVPKGPDTAWMAGLKALREAVGELPVNIAFLAEGDEILGSISYAGLLDRYRDRLADVAGLIYLRADQNDENVVSVRLGYKSFITFELTASGESWGRGPTAVGGAHSALRTIVDSPALRLTQAVGTLFTEDGRMAVDGWAEHLEPATPPAADLTVIEELLAHYAGRPMSQVIPGLAGTGVTAYVDGLADRALLERYMYGSALNIQGLRAGYTGPGTRTHTIPESAVARLDARLCTSASPSVFMDALRAHLDARGFADVEIDVLSAYPASRSSLDSPLMSAFLDAVREWGGKPVVWPVQAYGGPWSFLAHDWGTPLVFGTGIGHGGGVAQPNEYVVVDGGGRRNGLAEVAMFAADLVMGLADRMKERS